MDICAELSDGVLGRALARLPERDREVLLLVAWEGLSTQQAATVLDCSPRTFSMRLHRARRRLSAALEVIDGPRPQPCRETHER
ncbi:MAG: sigma-70 region 4 domain-containing protein [Solirubrobacteraceae bacterium]